MKVSKNQRLSLFFFLLISSVTLVFGLKPQGNFESGWVFPLPDKGIVLLGKYGYLQGILPEFSTPISDNSSLDFSFTLTTQLQLDSIFRIILFIGNDCQSNPMIIGQWRSQLIVMQGCDFLYESKQPRLSATLDVHKNTSLDLKILLGKTSSQLMVNGRVAASEQAKVIDPTLTEGSLLLIGNSVDGRHGWRGTISKFSVQRTQNNGSLTEEVNVLQNYVFSQVPNLNVFTSSMSEEYQLEIPEPGKFPDAVVLEYFPIIWLLEHEKLDLLLNFFGFTPFGLITAICLYCWLGVRGIKLILMLLPIAVIVSLSIELSQVYIAGRRSALHDLILNISGAILGAWILTVITKLRTLSTWLAAGLQ